jgi:hypothetical protein
MPRLPDRIAAVETHLRPAAGCLPRSITSAASLPVAKQRLDLHPIIVGIEKEPIDDSFLTLVPDRPRPRCRGFDVIDGFFGGCRIDAIGPVNRVRNLDPGVVHGPFDNRKTEVADVRSFISGFSDLSFRQANRAPSTLV